MTSYYNEIDPYAAQWLRNLIDAGHISPGVVDERSIEDVFPDDLRGFTQCHFFAGIGVWSYALRQAGWPDSRPVWTGSCPCQPFSAAGKGAGTSDERHLWPAWHHLIRVCRPVVVVGEQVEAAIAHGWLDLVCADLEAEGYAFGAVGLPAASVGAPHIRQRLWFVAHAGQERQQQHAQRHGQQIRGRQAPRRRDAGGCSELGYAFSNGSGWHAGAVPGAQSKAGRRMRCVANGAEPAGAVGDVGHANGEHEDSIGGLRGRSGSECGGSTGGVANAEQPHRGCEASATDHGGAQADGSANRAGGCGCAPGRLADGDGDGDGERYQGTAAFASARGRNGVAERGRDRFWDAADWIPCRDGKSRPVEPGTFPLAHGAPARVGRLRAYGNAIVAEAARVFIESYEGHP